MKFLLSWLKEFIELSVPPETLAERLTLAGLEVNSLTRTDDDWLFEAEVTPNRPDLLSHLGIARETAAALGRPFRFPRWLEREFRTPPSDGGTPFPVTVEDTEGCALYAGLIIDGVRVAPSPQELVRKLNRLGIRPVNNIVDITNLCLLELGQPLHAFDLSKLEGGTLMVRRARAGEKLETLDGVARALSPDLLIIADAKKPVALAGIMGGRASEIGLQTQQVFLESAWFKPALIRRGVRLAKASSDSSYRFERGVNPEMVLPAAMRAARWITRIAGGKIRASRAEIRHLETAVRTIPLKPKKAEAVLGMKSSLAQQRRILECLGCRVSGSSRGWRVEPPSWRLDLKISEDLYEELARLIGYDRCPTTLPPVPRKALGPNDTGPAMATASLSRENKIRALLVSAGAQEIMTYSLISPDQLSHCKLEPALNIRNPLSAEQACLRPSLLPGALGVLSLNLRRRTGSAFCLFEMGRVYGRQKESWERRSLSVLAAGAPDPHWNEKPPPLSLFHLKGITDFLCGRLELGPLTHRKSAATTWSKGVPHSFYLGSEVVGTAGMVQAGILSAFEIPAELPVAYAEIDLEKLLQKEPGLLKITPLAKVSAVVRDLAVLISEEIPYEELRQTVLESGRPLIRGSALFDLYQGKQVPAGKKSLALRLTFADQDRTLTEAEVNGAVQQIVSTLQKQFQASLRQPA